MPKNFQPILEELKTLLAQSKAARLPLADEQRGAALFKELIVTGGKASTAAVELLDELPWFISVAGASDAWNQLTPARQRSFLTALKGLKSDASKRSRLSIARGLYKIDGGASIKLLLTTLEELRPGGLFDLRDRQTLFGVLIGKSKPWLLQIDLKAVRPSEAQFLAGCALECIVSASPPSAISVIQWAQPFRTLGDLPESVQTDLGRAFRKWSGRWQKQLSQLSPPPAIEQFLRGQPNSNSGQEPVETRSAEEPPELQEAKPDSSTPASDPRRVSPDSKPRPLQTSHQTSQNAQIHRKQGHPRERPHPPKDDRYEREGQRQKTSGSKVPGSPGQKAFSHRHADIPDLLKEIESQFNSLRGELNLAKTQLKQNRPISDAKPSEAKESAKLREENAQLTETIAQLRQTLNDLASHNFDEAVSRGADTDTPLTDPLQQFKSLLTIRLRDEIANFQTLNRENHVDALPLLLDNILHMLEQSGIDLSNIQPPPLPAKRRY